MRKLIFALLILLFSDMTGFAALRLDLGMIGGVNHSGNWFITSDGETFKTSDNMYFTVQ